MSSHEHQLQLGAVSLRVNPAVGARISHFCFGDRNALFEADPQWGSTFWPSPQHAWGWPPPPILDSEPYQVNQLVGGLSFSSSPCDITGLQLHKEITLGDKGFIVSYQMSNLSAKTVSFAPWEITRVAGGITFFASEAEPLAHSSLQLTRAINCWWHHYDVDLQQANLKAFANGSEGWLANAHDGLLILKRFNRVPLAEIAPQEAEIEIYAHGDAAQAYIEVEQQGAYLALQPGDHSHWTVYWSLFEIPQHVEVAVGSESLVNWVGTLL